MTDMSYTRLGDTGLIVSRMCFGTMTFTLGADWIPGVAKVGQADADAMVAHALDHGVNFFDTADGYSDGQAEQVLGKALGKRRHAAVICTKLGFRQSDRIDDAGLSRGHILRQIEGSLQRMGTDHIDLLVLHKTDFTTPMEETLSTLQNAVTQGKVRYVGVSNWPAWQAARAIQFQRDHGMAAFSAGQYLYNAVARDLEHEVLPMMAGMGCGLMAWSPLAGGLLSGKYDPDKLEDGDGRLAIGGDFLAIDKSAAHAAVAAVQALAQAHDVEPASIALSWILAQRRDHTVIFGASKMSHVDAALAAPRVSLTDAELATLSDVAPPARTYPNWFDQMMTDEPLSRALS